MKLKLLSKLAASFMLLSLVFINTAAAQNSALDAISAIRDLLNRYQEQLNNAGTQNPLATSTNTYTNVSSGVGVGSGNNQCVQITVNLRSGDSGAQVRILTERLVAEGLLSASTETFNQTVFDAVVKYQEKYASEILTPEGVDRGTGFVGARTRAHMNARGCPGGGSGSTCVQLTANLRIGDSGAQVSALTAILVKEGLLSAPASTFTQAVFDAVVRYQEKYASSILAPDGIDRGTGFVGVRTRTHMNSRCSGTVAINTPPTNLSSSTLPNCRYNNMYQLICDNTPIPASATYLTAFPGVMEQVAYEQYITTKKNTPTPAGRQLLEATFDVCKNMAIKAVREKVIQNNAFNDRPGASGPWGVQSGKNSGETGLREQLRVSSEYVLQSTSHNCAKMFPKLLAKTLEGKPEEAKISDDVAEGISSLAYVFTANTTGFDQKTGERWSYKPNETSVDRINDIHGNAATSDIASGRYAGCQYFDEQYFQTFFPLMGQQFLFNEGHIGNSATKLETALLCKKTSLIKWNDDHMFSYVPDFEIQRNYAESELIQTPRIYPVTFLSGTGMDASDISAIPAQRVINTTNLKRLTGNGLFENDYTFIVVDRMREGVPVNFYARTSGDGVMVEASGLPPGLTFNKGVVANGNNQKSMDGCRIGHHVPFSSVGVCDTLPLGTITGTPVKGTYMTTFKTYLQENPSRYTITNVFFVVNGYERVGMDMTTESGTKNPAEVKKGDTLRITWKDSSSFSELREGKVFPPEVNVWAVPVSSATGLPDTISNRYLVGHKVRSNFAWQVGRWNSLYTPPVTPGRGDGSQLAALPDGRYVLYFTPVDLEGETYRVPSQMPGNLAKFAWTRPNFSGYDYTSHYGMSAQFEIKGGTLPGWDTDTDLYTQTAPGYNSLNGAYLMRARTSGGAKNERSGGINYSTAFARAVGHASDAQGPNGERYFLDIANALAEKNWLGGTIRVKAGETLTIDWFKMKYTPPVGNDGSVPYGRLQFNYYSQLAKDIRAENYSPYVAREAASSYVELETNDVPPVNIYSQTTGALTITGTNRSRCSTGFNLGDADGQRYNFLFTIIKPWTATNSFGSTSITIPECEKGRTYYIYYNGDGLGGGNLPNPSIGWSPSSYINGGTGMGLKIIVE